MLCKYCINVTFFRAFLAALKKLFFKYQVATGQCLISLIEIIKSLLSFSLSSSAVIIIARMFTEKMFMLA